MMLKALCGMALSFLLCASAMAQDGPSYEETVSYILDRTDVSKEVISPRVTHRQWVTFPSQCVLVYNIRNTRPDGVVEHNLTQTVKLDLLDPSEVGIGSMVLSISLVARELRQVIYLESQDGKSTDVRMNIEVNRPDNIPRIIKAFSHLIEVCGGREELF